MLSGRYIYLPQNMNNLKLSGYSTHHRVSYEALNLAAQYITFRMIPTSGRKSVAGTTTNYWLVRGSNPDAGETFRTRPDRLWVPLSLLNSAYRG